MIRRAIVSIAVLLVTACSLGPAYQKPSAPVQAAFKEASGPSDNGPWRPAQPSDDALRGKWWEIYGDPALNALEERVTVSNQSLAQAEAQFRGARAAVGLARSGLFPSVSAGASAARSSGVTSRSVSSTGAAPTINTFQLPVDLGWEADLFGRIRKSVESSLALAQASEADLESLRLALHAELAADYFTLRGLDAQKQLLDSTVTGYQTTLRITTNRYDQGVVSGADVAQARTQLETIRAEAIDLGVARAQVEHAIAILAGQPPGEFALAPAQSPVAPPQVPLILPSQLLERRPDIAGAERRMAAANAQVGIARAAYYPTLSLSGALGFQSSNLSSLFSLPARFWSIGAAVAEPLFDAGKRRATNEQAVAAWDGSVAAYRESVLTAFAQVEDNLAALRILADESVQQDQAVAAAERGLKLARNRYDAGVTSYLEVVTAQNAALANERTSVDLLTRRMVASVNLVKALGGGWQAPPNAAPLATSAAPAGEKPAARM